MLVYRSVVVSFKKTQQAFVEWLHLKTEQKKIAAPMDLKKLPKGRT